MFVFTFDTEEEKDKFLRLYDAYKQTVLYTIRRFLQDSYAEEDIFQEVFLILADHLDNMNEQDVRKTPNYIITITRNYCKRYLKKANRIPEDSIENWKDFREFPADDPALIDLFANQESFQKLCSHIRSLDEKYRAVLN